MKTKINPKRPIENWRFQISEDPDGIKSWLNLASSMGLDYYRSLQKTLDTAIAMGERHLEVHNFILLENGELKAGKIRGSTVNLFQIDLLDVSHANLLARLGHELELRKKGRKGLKPWSVHGHLKDNASYVDYLVLDNVGRFYLLNQQRRWRTMQDLAKRPLP